MGLWLIVLLIFTHSAAFAWGAIWMDLRATDHVNREWLLMDEWQRFTASPWGAWLRKPKRKSR